MVTLKYPEAQYDYPFDILAFKSYSVPFRNEYRFGFGKLDRKFWKTVSNIPFDIVHAHSPFSTGNIARRIAQARNIPLVATLHSKYKDDFKCVLKSDKLVNGVIKNIVRYFETADDVWTVNEASVETLREYGYKGDVFVVNNGSDIPVTIRDRETRQRVAQKFGFLPDAPIFTYVGQHTKQKNVMLIIKALNILHREGLNFHMLFIGDGPLRQELQSMCDKLGLGEKVQFVGRISDRDLLKKIYVSSEVVLFPSLYDSSSLVIKEAASCSCPTVVVEGGTTAQGVVDCENGFIVKNQADDLASKIRQIITTEGLAKKAGYGALNTLYKSWEDIVSKVYDRYDYLLNRKHVRFVV
jgi:glycosyltransferase involved in cell wall biosynthesis